MLDGPGRPACRSGRAVTVAGPRRSLVGRALDLVVAAQAWSRLGSAPAARPAAVPQSDAVIVMVRMTVMTTSEVQVGDVVRKKLTSIFTPTKARMTPRPS